MVTRESYKIRVSLYLCSNRKYQQFMVRILLTVQLQTAKTSEGACLSE